jgi:hypothetical protein
LSQSTNVAGGPKSRETLRVADGRWFHTMLLSTHFRIWLLAQKLMTLPIKTVEGPLLIIQLAYMVLNFKVSFHGKPHMPAEKCRHLDSKRVRYKI